MKTRLLLSIFSLLVISMVLVACSGTKRSPSTIGTPNNANLQDASRTASISLSIHWPEKPVEPTKLIPLAAQSIKIELRDANNNLIGGTPKVVARPATGNTSNVLFTALQPGSVSVKATAYPNTDATGIAQSTGTIATTITTGQTTAAALTMDSTIASVKINGNDGTALLVGNSRVLTAQALNSAGETVLVAPSQWEWTSGNTTNFTLTPSGESASVKANSVGSTTITLKDKESGKAASTSLSCDDGRLKNTKIVFVSQRDGTDQLYIMNSDGTGQLKLTSFTGFLVTLRYRLSPDSKKAVINISYSSIDYIYIVNTDGTGFKQITDSSSYNFATAFSPDSKKILFQSNRGSTFGDPKGELYLMNLDGSEQTRITNNSTGSSGSGNSFSGTFSPDSQNIAFLMRNDTGSANVHIMNADGSGTRQLTQFGANLFTFSPDGRKIVYTSSRDGKEDIYVLNIDGSGENKITNGMKNIFNLVFSPDGKKIGFSSDQNGNYEVYSINPDGSELKNLTDNLVFDAYPTFSPDGSRIAYFHLENNNAEIYSMNLDGSGKINITNHSLYDYDPTWSGFLP
jgi:Tol biopolymer transport system component